jgi:hypothetical protein
VRGVSDAPLCLMAMAYGLRSTAYGLHLPQRSRHNGLPHVPPGQCLALSMHGWPSLDQPVHVFTQVDPAPNAVTHALGVT